MTRPTTTWKNFERRVATLLGGQRIPASGNGDIKGDVLHPHFLIECKYGKQVPSTLTGWMDEAVRDRDTEKAFTGIEKPPLLVVQRPRGDAYAIMRLDDFAALARRAALVNPTPSQAALVRAAAVGVEASE